MFGKKKQKQETLVRMRNLAQLDEGFCRMGHRLYGIT
jgi:hypothetical protein